LCNYWIEQVEKLEEVKERREGKQERMEERNEENEDDNFCFQVERVLDHERREDGGVWYWTKCKGEGEISWVPEDNFESDEDFFILSQYWRQYFFKIQKKKK